MKSYQQLIQEVVFEAGGTGKQQLETVAGIMLKDVHVKMTGVVKYNELLVPEFSLTVADYSTGTLTLPSDYQHIDWDSFRIRIGGDSLYQSRLIRYNGRVQGGNYGPAAFFSNNGTQIKVWPYDELTNTDTFLLNYWRKPDMEVDGGIIPNSLEDTVKLEAIGRLALTLGSKNAGDYISLGKESRTFHFGSVDLPSQNES